MNIVLCRGERGGRGEGKGEYHISLIFLLGFLLVSSEGVKNLISGLTDGDGSHLSGVIDSSRQGVDLTDCEPGQGGEHEVEQVLPHVDHDVVVLEDALFDDITRNNCKSAPSNVVMAKYFPTYRSQVHQLPRLARKLLGASRIPLASLSASYAGHCSAEIQGPSSTMVDSTLSWGLARAMATKARRMQNLFMLTGWSFGCSRLEISANSASRPAGPGLYRETRGQLGLFLGRPGPALRPLGIR